MLVETGFFDAREPGVGAPEPPKVAGNLIQVDFAQRTDKGDPFTRAERVKLRRLMEVMDVLLTEVPGHGGCPMAQKAAGKVKGA
jgi:hypothetical protein